MKGGHLEGLVIDERMILKLTVCNGIGGWGLASSGSGLAPVTGSCEHSKEHSISIMCIKFHD